MENLYAEWVNHSTYDSAVKQRFNRWFCSECGYLRKSGWEHTSDGNRPMAKFCEKCGANIRVEDEETVRWIDVYLQKQLEQEG